MASYFLDTSALAKLYVREAGSETMVGLATSEEGHALAVLSITPVELRSALRRRQRDGDLGADEVARILERFTRHFENRYERLSVTDPLVDAASSLVDRYTLRAYDALQLAGCLDWKRSSTTDPVFVCSDTSLLAVAAAEGLATVDPAASKKVR